MKYKYTTAFENQIIASTNLHEEEWQISSASLDKLKGLIPEDIDLEKNIDLIGVAFNAAVVNRFNKNDDAIDTAAAMSIRDYFINKPTNIEHQREKVVGHIVSAAFSEFQKNQLIPDEDVAQLNTPFNIALGAVVYRMVNSKFAAALDRAHEEGWDKVISASWELGFNKYSIALGDSQDLDKLEIITKPEQVEEFKHYLKAYDGEGKTDDGVPVKRLVAGEIYPLGIAFTTSPAAEVEGLYIEKDAHTREAQEEDDASNEGEIICINDKCFVRGLIDLEEKISHSFKKDVIHNNKQAMDNTDIIQKLEDLLNQHSETKQGVVPEEAVANVSQFVFEQIREKSEEWAIERDKALAERDEFLQAEEGFKTSVKDLEEKLSQTESQLTELNEEKLERQAKERFNQRMAAIDTAYELDEEDLTVIASEVNLLEEDQSSFEEYQEKFSVIWKHKNKEAVAKANEDLQAEIEKAVQERLQTADASTTEDTRTEEEVVEQALENVEDTEAEIPNNNEELSGDDTPTLRKRFQAAFNKETLTVKY